MIIHCRELRRVRHTEPLNFGMRGAEYYNKTFQANPLTLLHPLPPLLQIPPSLNLFFLGHEISGRTKRQIGPFIPLSFPHQGTRRRIYTVKQRDLFMTSRLPVLCTEPLHLWHDSLPSVPFPWLVEFNEFLAGRIQTFNL